jgi:hypothetical protein
MIQIWIGIKMESQILIQNIRTKISFKEPVFYQAQGAMIFMREKPFPGPLEGVGLENQDFC